MRTSRCLALTLVAAALGLSSAASAQGVVLRAAGESSPFDWPYSTFTEGTVDANGRLVFAASSTGAFQRVGSILVRRIGAGVTLPDGRQVAGVGVPALAADGCVLARATFRMGGEAVVRACGTTYAIVIDAGSPAPGGGTIRAFDPSVFVAGTDVVAASATLEDGTSVLLRDDSKGLVETARSGNPAPSGGTYSAFRLLGVTATGDLGYRATVSDGPDGLFAAGDEGIRAIALVGQASPAGGSFTSIGGGTINATGQWAFRAGFGTDQSGIFARDASAPTAIRPLVVQGAAVPIAGATIKSFPGSIDPSINASGMVAFRALLAGATDPPRPSGVFVVRPDGSISKITAVRETIPKVGLISRLRDPVLADDGSVLVSALISGGGPVLAVARSGAFTALALLGDATDVDTGDARFRFGTGSVATAAEDAVFIGQRDGIFRTTAAGGVDAIAYTGLATSLGGVMAILGPPVVDGRGAAFFAADLQGARFNEALFVGSETGVQTFVSPDVRLLGGGGISELFPTNVDTLERPAGASRGAVFTATLQGAKATAGVFWFRTKRQVSLVARVGQRASGQRLASFGTPSVGPGNRVALLAEFGRDQNKKTGIVAKEGGAMSVVTLVGLSTRSRIGSVFAALGPPAAGRGGTVFHGTVAIKAAEGIFIGRGKRIGLVAGTGDTTQRGARLRTIDDPIVVGDDVWFLARASGSAAPPGLYRVHVPSIPRKSDPPLAVEAILLPGDPAPPPIGGVVVRLDAPRGGPTGVVSVVAEVGGGTAPSAILQVAPALP